MTNEIKLPKSWTGDIYMLVSTDNYNFGTISVADFNAADYIDDKILVATHKDVTLAVPDVDIDFRGEVIKKLKDRQDETRAKAEQDINQLQHKIDNLLQITYEAAE